MPPTAVLDIFVLLAVRVRLLAAVTLLLFLFLFSRQDVSRRTPTAFKLDGFEPGKRIVVKVNVGETEQEREARFTTPSDKTDWKIATYVVLSSFWSLFCLPFFFCLEFSHDFTPSRFNMTSTTVPGAC